MHDSGCRSFSGGEYNMFTIVTNDSDTGSLLLNALGDLGVEVRCVDDPFKLAAVAIGTDPGLLAIRVKGQQWDPWSPLFRLLRERGDQSTRIALIGRHAHVFDRSWYSLSGVDLFVNSGTELVAYCRNAIPATGPDTLRRHQPRVAAREAGALLLNRAERDYIEQKLINDLLTIDITSMSLEAVIQHGMRMLASRWAIDSLLVGILSDDLLDCFYCDSLRPRISELVAAMRSHIASEFAKNYSNKMVALFQVDSRSSGDGRPSAATVAEPTIVSADSNDTLCLILLPDGMPEGADELVSTLARILEHKVRYDRQLMLDFHDLSGLSFGQQFIQQFIGEEIRRTDIHDNRKFAFRIEISPAALPRRLNPLESRRVEGAIMRTIRHFVALGERAFRIGPFNYIGVIQSDSEGKLLRRLHQMDEAIGEAFSEAPPTAGEVCSSRWSLTLLEGGVSTQSRLVALMEEGAPLADWKSRHAADDSDVVVDISASRLR
jgi:hypothetical protein